MQKITGIEVWQKQGVYYAQAKTEGAKLELVFGRSEKEVQQKAKISIIKNSLARWKNPAILWDSVADVVIYANLVAKQERKDIRTLEDFTHNPDSIEGFLANHQGVITARIGQKIMLGRLQHFPRLIVLSKDK
ncbi:MAG: hypothetical protein AB4372_10600 [Xenococcus sp. (in: cyanobacteria)]